MSEKLAWDFQHASDRADIMLEWVLSSACDLQSYNRSIELLKTRYGFIRLAAEHPIKARHDADCIVGIIENELGFDYADVDEYSGKKTHSKKIQGSGVEFLGSLLRVENNVVCDTLRVLALATTKAVDPEIRARAASYLESAATTADNVQYGGPSMSWKAAEMHILGRSAKETINIRESNVCDALIEKIIDHLLLAVNDPDQYSRRKAIDAVSRMTNKFEYRRKEIVNTLLDTLQNDNTEAREDAAEGIGIIARNGNTDREFLINEVCEALDDDEPRVRVSAIRALREFDYHTIEWADDILPILLSVGANGDDSSVRKAAIEESKKYLISGTPDYPVLTFVLSEYYINIVKYFISVLEEETDFFVLEATQKSLKELYGVALEMDKHVPETEEPPSELVLRGLLHAIRVNEDGLVRMSAMRSLKQIIAEHSTDVSEDIRRIAETTELPPTDPLEVQEIPLMAPETLSNHPSQQVQQKISRLIRGLEINGEEQTPNDTRDDSVRILRSLANEDPEIIDDLVTTLLTARRREKGNTVLAAGLQGNAKAVISRAITGSDDVSVSLFGSVSAALDNPEEFVRSSAAELLGDAVESIPDYDAEIADALTNTYANDDNHTVRKNAIESLGTVLIESPDPQDGILKTLFTAIEDPHESVRKEAVRVLGKAVIDSNTNRDSILCHLVNSLDDNGNLVRSRSMSAIEELSEHDPDSVATYSESIVDVLVDRDGNSSVRSDAVRVLSRIGSRPETIEVLENRAVTVHRCANEEVFSPTNHTRLVDLLVRLDSEPTIK